MKTIDDIDYNKLWEKEHPNLDGYLDGFSLCHIVEFVNRINKQSVIEDIKELKKEAKERDSDFGLRDIDKGSYIGKIEYIEKKFNIKK